MIVKGRSHASDLGMCSKPVAQRDIWSAENVTGGDRRQNRKKPHESRPLPSGSWSSHSHLTFTVTMCCSRLCWILGIYRRDDLVDWERSISIIKVECPQCWTLIQHINWVLTDAGIYQWTDKLLVHLAVIFMGKLEQCQERNYMYQMVPSSIGKTDMGCWKIECLGVGGVAV